jgi:hypothetical protein
MMNAQWIGQQTAGKQLRETSSWRALGQQQQQEMDLWDEHGLLSKRRWIMKKEMDYDEQYGQKGPAATSECRVGGDGAAFAVTDAKPNITSWFYKLSYLPCRGRDEKREKSRGNISSTSTWPARSVFSFLTSCLALLTTREYYSLHSSIIACIPHL